MGKQLIRIYFALILTGILSITAAAAGSAVNIDPSGVAIQGYDPVSYFKGVEPRPGDPKISAKINGATYLFATPTDKQEFLRDPQKFIPQFGGWCAYAVADNKSKVEVDPKSFLIQDGKLLLFFNGYFADTRKKWRKNPDAFLKTANANWPDVKNKDPK